MSDSQTLPSDVIPEPNPVRADVGIVCATSIEIDPLLKRMTGRVTSHLTKIRIVSGTLHDSTAHPLRVSVAICGMGRRRATLGTELLLDGHHPGWVLSAGFSGGLSADLNVGEFVLGNSLFDSETSAEFLTPLKRQSESAGEETRIGRLLTVDRIVRTSAEKQQLADRYQALAVDMESAAVAAVCQQRAVRFLAVRVISDDLATDLPPEILTIVGGSGSMRLGATIGALWKRPGCISDLWPLRENALRCSDRLAAYLVSLLSQLASA